MSNETAKCNDQPATKRGCPEPAGFVPDQIEVQLSIITDFFDKHNADEIQWDALDRLRKSITLILGYAVESNDLFANF